MVQRQSDAALLAVAVRNVLRAAIAVAALGDDEVLDAAIKAFDAALPGASDLRDVLEHFDAYEARRGNLQKSGRMEAYHVFYERGADHYVLHVGDLALEVDTATDAAIDLAEATLKAVDRIVAAEARHRHGDRPLPTG